MTTPANPAVELYDYWLMVLNGARLNRRASTGCLSGNIQFGRDKYMGIGPVSEDPDKPDIGYGYVHWGSPDRFILNHEGHFRMAPMHGYKVRDAIERNTFLTWIHAWRCYNWTAVPYGGSRYRNLDDWEDQIPYTPEWAMGLAWGWQDNLNWLRLEHLDGAWQIRPVESGGLEVSEKAERLRAMRYRRAERAHLRRIGVLPPTKPSLSAEEREERREINREKAINVILTHFEVGTPAQSTPLRREREEGLWPVQLGRP